MIVHGSQDNNATATVLWDNAFAEPVSKCLSVFNILFRDDSTFELACFFVKCFRNTDHINFAVLCIKHTFIHTKTTLLYHSHDMTVNKGGVSLNT